MCYLHNTLHIAVTGPDTVGVILVARHTLAHSATNSSQSVELGSLTTALWIASSAELLISSYLDSPFLPLSSFFLIVFKQD